MIESAAPSPRLLAGSPSQSAGQLAERLEIPESVLRDNRLSRKAVHAYGILVRDRDIPIERIADSLDCTPKYARKLLSQLIDCGHLEVLQTRREKRRLSVRVLVALDRVMLEKVS